MAMTLVPNVPLSARHYGDNAAVKVMRQSGSASVVAKRTGGCTAR